MNPYQIFSISVIIFILLILSCKDGVGEKQVDTVITDIILPKISIVIDQSIKDQTIEGFRFICGVDVWESTQQP